MSNIDNTVGTTSNGGARRGVEEAREDVAGALGHARHAAEQVGGRLKEAGQSAAADVAAKVKEGASHKKDQASGSIRRVADGLDRAADNEEDEWARKMLHVGAASLKQASGYLSGFQVDDIVRDTEAFARRNPAAFLGASVALGFLLARIGKTAAVRAKGGSNEEFPRQDFGRQDFDRDSGPGWPSETGSM